MICGVGVTGVTVAVAVPVAGCPLQLHTVEQEIEQKLLREVRVKEMNIERKIRLVYSTRRALSHAAKAFLEIVG
jgi:DNA-binding transcriptional LysR family regulator